MNNIYDDEALSSFEAGHHSKTTSANDCEEFADSFIAASEHGFHVDADDLSPWKCTVPSYLVALHLNK